MQRCARKFLLLTFPWLLAIESQKNLSPDSPYALCPMLSATVAPTGIEPVSKV